MNIGQKVKSSAEVRDHMIASLRSELVGPSPGYPFVQLNGEEILRPQDPPRYRYACGILFPRGVTYSGSLDAADDEAGIDAAEAVSSKVEPGETDEPIDTSGEDITATDASADSTPDIDTEPDASSMFVPSTMGISFLADISGGLRIEASWGTYQKREIDGYPGLLGQQDPPKKTMEGRTLVPSAGEGFAHDDTQGARNSQMAKRTYRPRLE